MRSFAQACLLLVTTVTLSLKTGLCSERLNCTVLQLLNVQPYPDDGVFAGFDRGLDLVPAAHLAAEEINNRSDILAGFNLEIVDIDSEACGREIITKGLVNFYKELVSQDPSRCIVGVMGFVCSSVTNVLVPIISHQNIGYVILANSVSPAHRNNIKEYPNLFHTISSSSVINEALISLMQRFHWKRIGVVYDSVTIIYRTTAIDFIQRTLILPEIELTSKDLEVPADAEPSAVLAELGRSRFLLPYPLYTRGWLFRMYEQWYGSDWYHNSPETLRRDRLNKVRRWQHDRLSMLE